MKLMTDNEVLAFVDEFSADEIADSAHRLSALDSDPDWIISGVQRGFYKVRETRLGGRKLYRYFYHKNDQDRLVVNASVYVGVPGHGDDWLWMIGAEFIARELKCRGIVFESRRRGHLEQGFRAGFKFAGVTMQKDLEAKNENCVH